MPDTVALPRPPDLRDLRDAGGVALFLDFDGTLVELAPTPDSIEVPTDLARRLAGFSAVVEGRLALVSGRAIEDIERHLGPLDIARAGSHGSDCRLANGTVLGETPAGLPQEALAAIAQFATTHSFVLEDKPHGAALHFRHDETLETKGLAFARELAGKYALSVKRGKCVIELVARGANKGSAVEAFMRAEPFAGAIPVFVGDDVTDEDGFVAARRLGGFGVLVGEREDTAAQYSLENPATVYDWLKL